MLQFGGIWKDECGALRHYLKSGGRPSRRKMAEFVIRHGGDSIAGKGILRYSLPTACHVVNTFMNQAQNINDPKLSMVLENVTK